MTAFTGILGEYMVLLFPPNARTPVLGHACSCFARLFKEDEAPIEPDTLPSLHTRRIAFSLLPVSTKVSIPETIEPLGQKAYVTFLETVPSACI